MKLGDLAVQVPGARLLGEGEVSIENVTADSRQAGPRTLFVAVPGEHVDGHDFAAEAAGRGAALAVQRPDAVPDGAPGLVVADSRRALGELAAVLAGRPSRRLLLVGVTGTSGKTTVAHLAAHLIQASGRGCGLLSTVAEDVGAGLVENRSGLTTRDPVALQNALAGMVASGLPIAVLEVSSHALVQERVAGCDFDVAAYTNVGRDHLEYHSTWEEYLAAKARLLRLCAAAVPKGVPKTAVLNQDDPSYAPLTEIPIARRLSYSLAGPAELEARHLVSGGAGSAFELAWAGARRQVTLPLLGDFNVANALCAAGIALTFGLTLDEVASGLASFPGLAGRLEQVVGGQPFRVFIDFAHSAASLRRALQELRPLATGRLLAVFGSSARSDHDPAGMGEAASEVADFFWITTDDPVDADPARLAAAVAAGARPGSFAVELDRRAAIRAALREARPGDVVLLAGKGHERWMMVAGRQLEPWDERAEAQAALSGLGYAPPPTMRTISTTSPS